MTAGLIAGFFCGKTSVAGNEECIRTGCARSAHDDSVTFKRSAKKRTNYNVIENDMGKEWGLRASSRMNNFSRNHNVAYFS